MLRVRSIELIGRLAESTFDICGYSFTSTETPNVDFDLTVKNGVIIRAGESLRLIAHITGRPNPEVQWVKEEGELDKERVVIETEGKTSVLMIKDALRTDYGKYKVTGTNASGTTTAETRVDVMGT